MLPKRLGYSLGLFLPTVVRFDGLRGVIYPNDHRPAHVHVIGRGCEAVCHLNCRAGPVGIRENYGFLQRELEHVAGVLTDHFSKLCEEWEQIHESA